MKVTWKADVVIGIIPGESVTEQLTVKAEENNRMAARNAVVKEIHRSRISRNSPVSIRRLRMI